MHNRLARHLLTLLLLLTALLLGACTTNVTVNGDYPNALTRKQPLRIALVLDQQFSSYQFESGDDQRQPVTMALGESQVKLFSRVFTDMFQSTTTFSSLPGASDTLDLMVVPEVEEVQLATPLETQLNVYEVWLKYNFKVYDGNGKPVADWLMSAYGKTQSRFLKSDADALNQATVSALRDAGARLVIGFHRVPEIRQWLAQRDSKVQLSSREAP
ncbi:MAG: hypothetical protein EP334_08440 [Gammaproteobacteria bacterium]|nr:MAG: hypothetical protein EP334_08440 [Gammaproteobacteria bacterium]